MFCEKCGAPIGDGASFCQSCGTPVRTQNPAGQLNAGYGNAPQMNAGYNPQGRAYAGQAPTGQMNAGYNSAAPTFVDPPYPRPKDTGSVPSGRYVTKNIVQSEDGVFRWIYEFPMMKNPTILFTVYKVLLISFGLVYLFVAGLSLFEGGDMEEFLSTTGVFAVIILVFFVIGFIAYFILAASYGWKYIVLFEMDEEKIVHKQMPKQFDRTQAVAWLSMFVGIATGNIGRVGQGLMVAAKSTSTSTWKKVSKVKIKKRRNVIYVNETLEKNQVYAEDEDFAFVEEFIKSHCIKAKFK
ncbi:MAG: zinc-ribbon domain-containing protein [Lachnospiraceae bacterium]|nr:zinc-ribbon domain-containing protein [Lachnospiraceae bacterium]